ncbi:enoyl-CoA hydratase [Sphingorhabdus pulchriflava]|uniref:Enoyl-CoA hydratase n=1 Tax=Sphingorhabdus pulchriflava TaxID=2292257 RepID=A0A371BGF4_9SPHN|nr:enoyl-CoA hydratase-related protein [Sphingorhabdus pulchriflava]RDV06608.1 enoyl-CoA hydratase [Sphingorhabdus pulchriflava]
MQFITVEINGPVTTVTLNRPEVMNAINAQMHQELQAAFDAFAADAGQLACVITGAGDRAFCAGSDLKAAVADGHRDYPRNGYAGLIERFDCPKPFIAAVNGLALGGGFEVALACDIIIASEGASFGLPEPLVGAVALGGGVHRLARQIGLKQAMGMILTSRRVSAAEGARLGFVNEVVATGQLQAATLRWCSEILRASPMSIRASKEAVYRGLDESGVAAAMRNQKSYPAFAAWAESDDAREGPRAFAEKRPPVWKGR